MGAGQSDLPVANGSSKSIRVQVSEHIIEFEENILLQCANATEEHSQGENRTNPDVDYRSIFRDSFERNGFVNIPSRNVRKFPNYPSDFNRVFVSVWIEDERNQNGFRKLCYNFSPDKKRCILVQNDGIQYSKLDKPMVGYGTFYLRPEKSVTDIILANSGALADDEQSNDEPGLILQVREDGPDDAYRRFIRTLILFWVRRRR